MAHQRPTYATEASNPDQTDRAPARRVCYSHVSTSLALDRPRRLRGTPREKEAPPASRFDAVVAPVYYAYSSDFWGVLGLGLGLGLGRPCSMRILLTSGVSLAIVSIAIVSMVAPVYYAYSFDFWDHLAASTNLTLRLRLPLRLPLPLPQP